MAAAAVPEMVTITINDIEIQVPKGELIVESVKRLGLEIPIFCYHPRMKPVGMCRMCLVEVGFRQPDGSVRKMPKPQAGCTLPADNNMVIYTDTEMVHHDRKGVLEFLLINHPLDCPICDRGGECPLQNNTIFYGPSTSRFTELKRHAHKAFPLSQYVTLDLERCIQCGRCVRFTEEISGDSQLAFRFRGASMQPSTYQLTDFESKFSGNVIEICPVGALTNAKYRFRARPWDLETRPATCLECANHCSVHFDYRGGKFVRINGRTNEAVNEEWTCDKGKFGHDYYNSDKRLKQVLIRDGRGFRKASWSEAYELLLAEFKGDKAAVLIGGKVSNEGLFLLNKFVDEVAKTPHVDSRWSGSHTVSVAESTIASLEHDAKIVLFGGSLAEEQPMVYLRVRKAWSRNDAHVTVVSSKPVDAEQFAQTVIRIAEGTEHAVAAALNGKDVDENIRRAGLSATEFETLREATRQATILTSESLRRLPNGDDASENLRKFASDHGGKFNQYRTEGNAVGAEILGLTPMKGGMTTDQILHAAATFQLRALWLVDCNPFDLVSDRLLVEQALEHVDFLVVQGTVENEVTGYASLVLPAAAPAEQDGTYTNIEGRVQRLRQVIQGPGDAKAYWRTFAELLMRGRPGQPYFSAAEVFAAIPQFKGLNPDAEEGALAPLRPLIHA